jgi:hypothetical protein
VSKISDLLVLTSLMLFFILVPIVIRVVRTKKFEIKIAINTLVSGLVFAYSFFYGVKTLFFVFSEEFKQYDLPTGYDGYTVLGILIFISVTFLYYFETGLKDLFKHQKRKITDKKFIPPKLSSRTKKTLEFRFQALIDQIDDLKNQRNEIAVFEEWKNIAESLIRRHFGEKSSFYKKFLNIDYYPSIGGMDETYKQKRFEQGLEKAKGQLKACLNELMER